MAAIISPERRGSGVYGRVREGTNPDENDRKKTETNIGKRERKTFIAMEIERKKNC